MLKVFLQYVSVKKTFAFANDICNASELLFYILYADDTTVLLKGKELRELLVILNEELERINLWLKQWRIQGGPGGLGPPPLEMLKV